MQNTEVGTWEILIEGDQTQEQIAWKVVESPLWLCSRLDKAQPEESYWMRRALKQMFGLDILSLYYSVILWKYATWKPNFALASQSYLKIIVN